MIEIEKKFLLNDSDLENIAAKTEFLSEQIIEDIYYDTTDYRLTIQDIWLRKRNNKFELKLPLLNLAKFITPIDRYEETESEEIIRKTLKLPLIGNLEQLLIETGYQPFFQGWTTRRKYKKGHIFIDIDSVESGDFYYSLAELEILVEDETKIAEAEKHILDCAEELGLKIALVRGKVIEYLKRMKPAHYHALIKAGVVKDEENG